MSNVSPQLALRLQPERHHALERFWPGPNETVLKALQLALDGEGEKLLYLWGNSGVGKTHLLKGACLAAEQKHLTCAYLALSDLVDNSPKTIEGIEQRDLVAIDDIQAITGDRDWEHALFAVVNELRLNEKILLVAADRPSTGLALRLPDLRTRLGWGVTLQIEALNDQDKALALQADAKSRGFTLNDDMLKYLFRYSARDLATLSKVLDRLDKTCLRQKTKPSRYWLARVIQNQE